MDRKPHQPQKRVTLHDLAQELGVSDRTVSQALRPRESNVKLNPKTAERIQKLALERNYRPDVRAQSMRYGCFFNIGYFEAKKTATGWPLLGAEAGVFDVASEHHYNVSLMRLPADFARDPSAIPSVLREGNVDALIIAHAGNLTQKLEQMIDACDFPVVYLNEKKPTNAVYVDDLGGAEELTQYLISLGNRKIVCFSSDITTGDLHYSVKDRAQGYKNAMQKAGLEPEIVKLVSESFEKEKYARIKNWFEACRDVDAIVCDGDFMAFQALRGLYNDSRKVPQDLAITGFGDDFARNCSSVPLTTMQIPFYEMGRTAAEIALTLIDQKKKTVPSRVFKPTLVVRDSTRNRLG